MSRHHLGLALLCLGVLVLVGGLSVLIAWDFQGEDRRQADEQHRQDVRLETANHACGMPPAAIKLHGPSWSFGSWVEVTCTDGTKRAIR